ncbi:MAG TPA: hypothetical protein VM582_01535 [Candidatus Thermoplasmatota archaeon]|nr:hypothetical protein [Candidatus Thermoplasmatota archaeon]
MRREAAITVALALALLTLAPAAPALPESACDLAAVAEEAAQNDAGSGADAPDERASAWALPADDYYWAWLSPAQKGRTDTHDWYAFDVPAGRLSLMASVTANYSLLYVHSFYLALHPPDGGAPFLTSSEGVPISVPHPTPGRWLVELTASHAAYAEVCAPAAAQPTLGPAHTEVARNHGLYIGCNPVCLEARAT